METRTLPSLQKLLITSLFILGLFISGYSQTSKYVKVQGLNLRSQPTVEAESILQLDKGTEVLAYETTNGWTRVEFNGTVGYVSAGYLSVSQIQQSSTKREAAVLICNSRSAYAYHSHECHGLARCKASVSSVGISEAREMGYVACKICY